MSRLIDADALKKSVLDLHDCYNGFSDTYDKACIIGIIDEQPTTDSQRWIPVSERLPECGQDILAWVLDSRDGHMTVARFDDGKAYWSYMNRNYYPKGEIVAWMPMPGPYREETE